MGGTKKSLDSGKAVTESRKIARTATSIRRFSAINSPGTPSASFREISPRRRDRRFVIPLFMEEETLRRPRSVKIRPLE